MREKLAEDIALRLELLEAIGRGVQAAKQGATVSHDEAMRQLDRLVKGSRAQ